MFDKTRKKIKNKAKSMWNIDTIVDVAVDVLLVIFDVIYSPVLIIVRMIRHFFSEYIIDTLKNNIKKVIHWWMELTPERKVIVKNRIKLAILIPIFLLTAVPVMLIKLGIV